jgi:hypothetical protein
MDCRIKSGNDDGKQALFRRRGRRRQVRGTVRRRKVRSEAERQGEQLDVVEKISSASLRAIGFVFGEDKIDAAAHELVNGRIGRRR